MDSRAPLLAIGIDLVEIDRIAGVLARHPERFLSRHFTLAERQQCAGDPSRLAACWAGKEAAAKALGTGIGPVAWRDLEILTLPTGRPVLKLHGSAGRIARELGLDNWSISLTHARHHAAAVVVALGRPTGE